MALSQIWRHPWLLLAIVALAGLIAGHYSDDVLRAAWQRLRPVTAGGPSSASTAYYNQRRDLFALSKLKTAEIVMLGDSHIELGRWYEITGCRSIVNRGIGGDTTGGVLARLDSIIAMKPRVVVYAAGTNDILRDSVPVATIARNIRQAVARLHAAGIKVIVTYLPPTAWTYRDGRANATIAQVNAEIEGLAKTLGVETADFRKAVADDKGGLREDKHFDGIHFNGAAMADWRDALMPHLGCAN